MTSGPDQASEWLAPTTIWVGSGSSPPSWANIRSKIGTMKIITAVIRTALNSRTITGYVRALLIFPRSAASFSKLPAMRSSAPSRNPPVSPARIIATISRGKIRSCFASAADSEIPASTSARTSTTALRSRGLALCSSSTASERSSDIPDEVRVANCRANTARSLRVTRPPSPGILISLRSTESVEEIDSGTDPCWRSSAAAATSLAASTLPRERLPRLSTTSYAKVLVTAAIAVTPARPGA